MISCSIIPWQIEGGKKETVMDFIFLGFRITTDDDCSYEIKRWLLLGRKAMLNLDSVLKSRDITLPKKLHIGKVFPLVMYDCESQTIKEVECQRAEAFKLWCERRLLWVFWTEERLNPLILK